MTHPIPVSAIPVSVIVLAHRDDLKLRTCLNSVSWAAEIIVGWNGSADHLPDLSDLQQQSCLIQLIRVPDQITDFSATRNFVQTHAHQPWVFWIDSDEVLTPESIPEIEQLVKSDTIGGVFIHRYDVFTGRILKWGEVKNVQLLRLFRSSSGQFERPIHEVAKVPGQLMMSSITLHHFAHDSISIFFQKIIRYAQQEAEYRRQHHRPSSLFELIVWPTGKFCNSVFLRWAFLDGWQGMTYALVMSIHSLAVRALLRETPPKPLHEYP